MRVSAVFPNPDIYRPALGDPMLKENQIRTLTTHVYGPYYDYLLFKNTFPLDGTTLEIKDLQMYTKDREVG